MLRKSRSESAKQELANYYLVDTFRNAIIECHVHLSELEESTQTDLAVTIHGGDFLHSIRV
jgi:hypothetical protein